MRIIKLLGLGMLLLMANTVCAQEVGEVVDSVKAGLKSGNVKEAVSKVKDSFKVKKASAEALIGTWQYAAPAVYATKGNLLMKLAGNAAAGQVEKLLQDYTDKSNISSENTFMTFHQDGTFERDIVGRKAKGVWMVNGEKLMLAIDNVQTADITTHLDEGQLMLLIDVDKMLKAMQVLGAMKDSKSNKALIKVTKRVPGLQAGLLLVKKQ
jgi:hypothetical protein